MGLSLKTLVAVLLLAMPALAQGQEACTVLKSQRDRLSSEAMGFEIALVKTYRERVCPALSRRADAANANDKLYAPIDYEALVICRSKAEKMLERDGKILYRNSLGFTFYTQKGADLSKEADRLVRAMQGQGCQ